uniref:Uncharacterized protein n=1 Tax=viral metagenome TaxID=1070528 RepID=A0A6C0EZ22_9ZZZZ
MQKINHQQLRGQQPQQHKQQQFNIPKTPEQLFIKNKDINHPAIPATNTSLKTVKYIDELYTKQFLDEYFTI